MRFLPAKDVPVVVGLDDAAGVETAVKGWASGFLDRAVYSNLNCRRVK